jgi:hypothetical protein
MVSTDQTTGHGAHTMTTNTHVRDCLHSAKMPAVLRSRTTSKETAPPDPVDSTESDSTLDLTPPT